MKNRCCKGATKADTIFCRVYQSKKITALPWFLQESIHTNLFQNFLTLTLTLNQFLKDIDLICWACAIFRWIPNLQAPWLAMSGFVSVSDTSQRTDICVCRRHVNNVGPTLRRHSLKSAFFHQQSRVGKSYPQHTFLRVRRDHYWWGHRKIRKIGILSDFSSSRKYLL